MTALDDILGPPSVRERVTGELIVALGQYDYGPEHEDEIAYPDRHREATALLTRVAPLLIEHGYKQAAREVVLDTDLADWDALDSALRWRPGWRVVFRDGDPVWRCGSVEVAVGRFSDPPDTGPYPYLVQFDKDDDGQHSALVDLPVLVARLPDLEAEPDAEPA